MTQEHEGKEVKMYKTRMNVFLAAGVVASVVSVPAGFALLGIAGYEYLKMREARKSS